MQDDRQIELHDDLNETKGEQKLEKETEKQINETSLRFNTTVEGLQKRQSMLEKE